MSISGVANFLTILFVWNHIEIKITVFLLLKFEILLKKEFVKNA